MASTKKRPNKKAKAKRGFWGKLGIAALVTFLIVGFSGLGGFAFLYFTTDLPDPNDDFQTNTSFIYYGDGETQMGSLSVQNRQTIGYSEMPQVIRDAVVAAENRSFWEDPGFSARGLARAAWSIASGGQMQGGSTITQQYIKILYLDSERTLTRKAREIMLAIRMGREVPKEEILAGYLNTIYFGRGAYGIQAASRSYFLTDAEDLTLSQAAALAAILNNPAAMNPSDGEDKRAVLLERYNYVLDGMLEMGTIGKAEHDEVYGELPEFPEVPLNNRYGGAKGFLMKAVEKEMETLGFDEVETQGGGLRIITTIDEKAQEAAVETVERYTKEASGNAGSDAEDLHVALASVDTETGAIIAMYGGPDYVENQRNWATTPRATASTFKTFATVAGLRNGFTLNSMFNGNTFTPRGDDRPIRNEFSYQYGQVSLRRATAESINTAFVDMTQQIDDGAREVAKAAVDAGAPELEAWELNMNNRIALGAVEVSPVNMANAYATLANSGKRNETHIVAKVTDQHGQVLYEAKPASEQTIEADVAASTTDALTSVVQEGTGRRASSLGRPVAGKTGTHGVLDDIQSAWFVGYTKQVSTAVMYVAGDGTADLDPFRRPQDPTFFGSSYPLMTWIDFMEVATDGMPVEQFDDLPLKNRQGGGERTQAPPRTTEPRPSESTSETPSPSPTPTATQTEEPEPTSTPSRTAEPTPTQTPTPEPTPTATQTPAPEQPDSDTNADGGDVGGGDPAAGADG
ncbi:transglycosylase domain-containing protein [Tessaracoccus caeni]|uniref:transglycosylase domain-containing protein n=1 Tax=Tessaracoccus caeni TaxID=3031239 RepID=UPI0023DC9A8D|nr:transglycosylase domain-containing protein [Tessaracoccus caeni]MDF1487503.1 transglycosylase domain-containing protein [Tessaracoccus caeni]